ncbi:MAG: NAD(P)/FAD-dependent oxidoreductase [Acidobacteriota bacterium]
MNSHPVAIVGAGLAGLGCALELQRRNIPFQLFEASDSPGGRVRTDSVDGFLLDRGFQVYLTAYPEGQQLLDYPSLQIGRFLPGAMVRLDGRFHRVMDPWREPFAALSHILNPVGSMADKLLVARLRASSLAGRPEDILKRPESSSLQALRRYGFSSNMIDRFFRPFFGGIMLDSSLAVSSRMLEYTFRMMASGDTVLPAAGMGAIPAQLAARLPQSSLRFNSPITAVTPTSVRLLTGEIIPASAVVIATEGQNACRLLPGQLPPLSARAVLALYFALPSPPPVTDPIIVLNGNPDGPIQNLCIPSLVSPAYAPAGQHLLSVTVLGNPDIPDLTIESEVRSQLSRWFNADTRPWRLLRLYRIPWAHPASQPDSLTERPALLPSGIFICGDHRFLPSIQAALLNGRHAAESVAAHVA